MNDKYAIFIDIDGTLIADSLIVPQENIDCLRKAQAAGHRVFVNTGRSKGNIPKVLCEQIDFFDGIVCGNGSHIIIDGKDVFKTGIGVDTLCKLSRYFLEHKELWCIFEGENDVFLIPDSVGTRNPEDLIPIESEDDFITKFADSVIETAAVGRHVPDDFEEIFKDELTVFRLGHYADCVSKGCCKANAMLEVLKILSIPIENSIAIGDSANDLSMLLAAGISVAMGNAPDEIKCRTDFVTDTNKRAGVAAAIEKILFSENCK